VAGPDRMTIEEVVRKVFLDEHAGVLRESLKLLVRELMEIEVSELIGAELGERRPDDRATHRNGYKRSSRSSSKRMCAASGPAAWTSWSSRSGCAPRALR
jgi:transposase-like protein